MTIGPEPMSRILLRSVRRGISVRPLGDGCLLCSAGLDSYYGGRTALQEGRRSPHRPPPTGEHEAEREHSMTPEDFLAAVTDRLHRQGADSRPEEVKAFTAGAWMQGEPPPDPDMWAERFLADPARCRPVRKQHGWFGRAAGGGIAGGLVGGATTTAILAILILVAVQFDPTAGMAIVVLSFMWLPGGLLGGLLGALLQAGGLRRGWLLGGCLGGVLAPLLVWTLCFLYQILNLGQYL